MAVTDFVSMMQTGDVTLANYGDSGGLHPWTETTEFK